MPQLAEIDRSFPMDVQDCVRGFMLFGLSLSAMVVVGGVQAGMVVEDIAGFISRATKLKEDASLAAMCLVALASGVRRQASP